MRSEVTNVSVNPDSNLALASTVVKISMNVTKGMIFVTGQPRYAVTELDTMSANVELVIAGCLNTGAETLTSVRWIRMTAAMVVPTRLVVSGAPVQRGTSSVQATANSVLTGTNAFLLMAVVSGTVKTQLARINAPVRAAMYWLMTSTSVKMSMSAVMRLTTSAIVLPLTVITTAVDINVTVRVATNTSRETSTSVN